MSDFDVEKRIQKMVNAIKQEAQDKADVIRENASSQFNIDKVRIYNQEKEAIQEDYRQKLENYSIKKRIERSGKISESRLTKMSKRHELITKLKDEVKAQVIQKFQSDQGLYKQFLKKLIVEAMVKLMEPEISLRCLSKDVSVCDSLKQECETEFAKLVKEKCKGAVLNSKITINKGQNLDNESTKIAGGVILSCFDGRITCANTLDNRIDLCFQEMLPEIRHGLFPASN